MREALTEAVDVAEKEVAVWEDLVAALPKTEQNLHEQFDSFDGKIKEVHGNLTGRGLPNDLQSGLP